MKYWYIIYLYIYILKILPFNVFFTIIEYMTNCAFQDKMEATSKRGESFEIFSNISLCTFDVILQCAMSYQDDVQTKE